MNSSKRILIIEDDKNIARFVSLELEHEGYQTAVQDNGRKGLEEAMSKDYDLILLDLMLPELDGFEVARRLRREKDTHIIMMTARDSTMDRVAGLDIGADDYITKPFAIEELLARVRSLFRREDHIHTIEKSDNTSFRDLVIDKTNRTVHRGKKVIDLTRREYDLLLTLMQNVGDVVTREYLVSEVWGFEEGTETNVVDVYIRYLRNKIDVEGRESYIQTVRGMGYVMRDRK
ncbi:response regulator transcription factor [Lactococcus petauri]|uniref:Transcriptional regulatory protein DltR n=1 Tax=Lactococcus petauri TaxID=1940789 RepID=A0AAJ2IWT3_9LACT|nr:response regulator transcription factor [Lactococcus petauri]MDT2526247.1 response regulator transcription factor [Lactococcus petauri]MDT2540792.1 response regulator transcription factor [Lactococcus petauri]MDT2557366.1 response regulator transcription factor [Lactococcus petauri]MDT2559559.1 response regulator transcription factor [Lactococcus petauri]MDT2568132.1 response regulator transcription factor [Lactococcus petauri]